MIKDDKDTTIWKTQIDYLDKMELMRYLAKVDFPVFLFPHKRI